MAKKRTSRSSTRKNERVGGRDRTLANLWIDENPEVRFVEGTWHVLHERTGHWYRDNDEAKRRMGKTFDRYFRKLPEHEQKLAEQQRQHHIEQSALAIAQYERTPSRYGSGIQFDNRPDLLGCQSGVIDLRTGDVRSARPDEYVRTFLSYDPATSDALPKIFNSYMDHVSNGDSKVKAWLMRYLGLCLTGVANARIVLFIIGTRGSGKTTFCRFLHEFLEGYATSINSENLDARNFRTHATWKADTVGRRVITMSEIKDGLALNTAILNELSGGDRIKANFMRRDEFEFVAQGKWIIVGNHKPKLPANTDDGIYDRLRYLDLSHRPPKVDPYLLEKLKAERPQVLRILIEEAKMYFEEGLLETPSQMKADAQEFEVEQDEFKIAIEDLIERNSDVLIRKDPNRGRIVWVGDLRETYSAESHSIVPKNRFTRELRKRFKVSERTTRTLEDGQHVSDYFIDASNFEDGLTPRAQIENGQEIVA